MSLADLYERFTTTGDVRPLLEKLGNELLFLPSEGFERAGDLLRVRPLLVEYFGRLRVAVFTTQETLANYSSGTGQCLAIHGWSISQCLRPGASLLINPGSEYPILVEGEELLLLRGESLPATEDLFTEEARADSFEIDNGREGQASLLADIPQIETALYALCERHPEVIEAYYGAPGWDYSGGILGVITVPILPESRSQLLADIGEISEQYFGSADAMYVVDDVARKLSVQWDELSGLTPFYSRHSTSEAETTYVSSGRIRLSAEEKRMLAPRPSAAFFRRS